MSKHSNGNKQPKTQTKHPIKALLKQGRASNVQGKSENAVGMPLAIPLSELPPTNARPILGVQYSRPSKSEIANPEMAIAIELDTGLPCMAQKRLREARAALHDVLAANYEHPALNNKNNVTPQALDEIAAGIIVTKSVQANATARSASQEGREKADCAREHIQVSGYSQSRILH